MARIMTVRNRTEEKMRKGHIGAVAAQAAQRLQPDDGRMEDSEMAPTRSQRVLREPLGICFPLRCGGKTLGGGEAPQDFIATTTLDVHVLLLGRR